MLEFVAKSGVIIIGLYLYLFAIGSWVDLIDNIDDDYDYCYNCKYGLCTETPKSKKCLKWRDKHENQSDKQADNFRSND